MGIASNSQHQGEKITRAKFWPNRARVSARLARPACLGVCAALLLGLSISFGALLHSDVGGMKRTDFITPYSAAHLVIDGHGDAIYNFRTLGRYESVLVAPLKVKNGVLPYLNAPYFAVVLAPLGMLPYAPGYALWLLINCCLLALVLFGLRRYTRLERGDELLLWLAALSFLPVFIALAQGQTSIIVLAALSLTFYFLRTNRDAPAGAVLAFVIVKAPYILPFLLLIVVQRRWRALAACTGTSLCLLTLPMAVLGTSIDAGYIHSLTQATAWRTQIGGYEPQFNHSFAGFTQLFLPPPWSLMTTLVLDVLALLALADSASRRGQIDTSFGLAVVVALLIAPHVLIHDLALLLLPAAALLRSRLEGSVPFLLAFGYLAILAGLPLVSFVPVQLSVLFMCALATCLYRAAARSWRPTLVPTLGFLGQSKAGEIAR